MFSGYTVNPSDTEVPIGSTAHFECHYSNIHDVDIHTTWVVNGTVLNTAATQLCDSSASTSSRNDVVISSLQVYVAIECDGIEVQCVAVWFNGSVVVTERSSSAILHILGTFRYTFIIMN